MVGPVVVLHAGDQNAMRTLRVRHRHKAPVQNPETYEPTAGPPQLGQEAQRRAGHLPSAAKYPVLLRAGCLHTCHPALSDSPSAENRERISATKSPFTPAPDSTSLVS